MLKVLEIPLSMDLSAFSKWLFLKRIDHRISESQGVQILWVRDHDHADHLRQVLQHYLADERFRQQIDEEVADVELRPVPVQLPFERPSFATAPLVMILVFLSLVLAWMTDFGQGGGVLRALLIINPFDFSYDVHSYGGRLRALYETLMAGQVWRLVTPDLIHFNVMHLVFNMLMFWVLGGQLESRQGSSSFLQLFLVVSIVSNLAQLLDTGYLFGGMSGVVYGLVGYCWLWSRWYPGQIWFPPALMALSLFWMFLGMTDFTASVGFGKMANSAHAFGLFAGICWAFLSRLIYGSRS